MTERMEEAFLAKLTPPDAVRFRKVVPLAAVSYTLVGFESWFPRCVLEDRPPGPPGVVPSTGRQYVYERLIAVAASTPSYKPWPSWPVTSLPVSRGVGRRRRPCRCTRPSGPSADSERRRPPRERCCLRPPPIDVVAVLAAESGDPHRSALLVGGSDQYRCDRRIRSRPEFKHAHAWSSTGSALA